MINGRRIAVFTICALFIVLAGCTTASEKKVRGPIFKTAYEKARVNKAEVENTFADDEAPQTEEELMERKKDIVEVPTLMEGYSGGAVFVENTSYDATELKLPSGDVNISVDDIPVKEFIITVFGDIFGVTYNMDPEVEKINKGITLQMTESMESDDFMNLVVELLKRHNVDVEINNGAFFFSRGRGNYQAEPEKPLVIIGKDLPVGLNPHTMVTQVIPVQYINPDYYKSFIQKHALGFGSKVDTVPGTKTMMITDRLSDVKRAVKLVEAFDRPQLFGKKTKLYYFDNMLPSEFKVEIEKILKTQGYEIAESGNDPGVLFIPIDRIEALLVAYSNDKWNETINFWKEKLDKEVFTGEKKRLFVYKPKNRDAESLRSVFESLVSGAKTPRPSAQDNQEETASVKSNEGSVELKDFSISISVDEGRNQLLISATPAEYKEFLRVAEKLDSLPNQVLVEVTIADVTLTDALQYGIEWYLKQSGDFNGAIQTMGGLGVGGAGLVYSAANESGYFKTLMNAFAENDLINVISTPHILVLDGKNASINVGTEVPVVTSETSAGDLGGTDNNPTIVRNVQYRSTGVSLSVTPVVNSDGFLTMTISQELSEAQSNSTSSIDSPIILNRSIQTEVNLKSGETVLLGGLIRENESESMNKIPLLGDIPILGHLFKVQSMSKQKTELIIQITPYILSQADDVRNIADAVEKEFELINREER
ncbi:secretin N-terminal domain-containing protein [Limisalsivibrio acetivorans]|uniref:secretin N-terminal domain-containing protein n=1 Tax=Limisalsivibrio acetivorans TaxID=1304888 RepID=UPI0003B37B36|nr:secretin N-terminal domain-containing protein [Limisalsivibrio acetivorans]